MESISIRAYNGTLQKGEGDCDRDRDCAKGLKNVHMVECKYLELEIQEPLNGRDFCYDLMITC